MPATRFALFNGPGKPFEIRERPLPARLGDGEVLVAIDLATICGSDLPRHLDAAIAFLSQHQRSHPWTELVGLTWPLARLNEAFAEAGSRRWHRGAVSPGD